MTVLRFLQEQLLHPHGLAAPSEEPAQGVKRRGLSVADDSQRRVRRRRIGRPAELGFQIHQTIEGNVAPRRRSQEPRRYMMRRKTPLDGAVQVNAPQRGKRTVPLSARKAVQGNDAVSHTGLDVNLTDRIRTNVPLPQIKIDIDSGIFQRTRKIDDAVYPSMHRVVFNVGNRQKIMDVPIGHAGMTIRNHGINIYRRLQRIVPAVLIKAEGSKGQLVPPQRYLTVSVRHCGTIKEQ